MRMLLRLDSIRQDSTGWTATFYGKPDISLNCIFVPVDEETAATLVVGKQYMFEEVPDGKH